MDSEEMARNTCVSLFAFFVAVLGLLANVLSVGTTDWMVSMNDEKISIGIFRHCDIDTHYCGGMSEISALVDGQEVAWFRAVQALFLLACLGSLLICVLIGLVLITFFDALLTFRVISVICFITVVSEILSIVFFGLHYKDVFVISPNGDAYLSYSFYMAIVAVFFLFVAFIASVIEASQTSRVLQNMHHKLTVWSTPYTLFVDQEA